MMRQILKTQIKNCGYRRFLPLTILVLLAALQLLHASFEPGKWPAAYLARGSSGIAVTGLENGFIVNPALLPWQEGNNISLFYRNYYSLSNLNDFSLAARFRIFEIPLGISFDQFGDRNYHEQTLSFNAAWTFAKNLSFGAAVRLFLLNVRHYRQTSAFGGSLGLHYRFSKKIAVAAVAGNLNEPRLYGRQGNIPVYFSTGLEVEPVKKLSLSFDIFKDNRFDFDFRFGVGYQMFSSIKLLLGFQQQIHAFTAGIQIRKTMVHFGYALEMHPDLGISNAIEVGYVF